MSCRCCCCFTCLCRRLCCKGPQKDDGDDGNSIKDGEMIPVKVEGRPSRVLEACLKADVQTLKAILKEDQDGGKMIREARDTQGATAVHYAARATVTAAMSIDKLMDLLVKECDCDVGLSTNVGATAAHDAAAKGNLRLLQWIVGKSGVAELLRRDNCGASVLHIAARYNRVQVVEWLLRQPGGMPSLAAERAHNGSLALHYAAANGCLECVKALVDHCPELSPNCQMENDVTPVYLAAQEGHLEVLKYLVEKAGGNLQLRAKDGMAPVHAAAQMGSLNCLKWMVTDKKVDPNTTDDDGTTAVHFAASNGHVTTLSWLLKNGARIMADKHGRTPLHDAEENRHTECLALLVQHDIDMGNPKRASKTEIHSDKNGFKSSTPQQPKSILRNGAPARKQPFYLHPPPSLDSGVTTNPENANGNSSKPFYLHDPTRQPDDPVREIFTARRPSDTTSSSTMPQIPKNDDDDNNNRQRSSYDANVVAMNDHNNSNGVADDLPAVHRKRSSGPDTPPIDTQPKAITVIADVHSSDESTMSISDVSEHHEYEEPFGLQDISDGHHQMHDSPKSSTKSSRRVSFTTELAEDAMDKEPPSEDAPPPPQVSNVAIELVVTSPVLKTKLDGSVVDAPTDEAFNVILQKSSPPVVNGKRTSAQNVKTSPYPHHNNPDARIISRQISLPDSQVAAPPPPPPLPPPPLQSNNNTLKSVKLKCNTLDRKMVRGDSPILNSTDDSDEEGGGEILPRTPQRHPLAKAFVPPQFLSPSQGDTLIKPSEYLRTVAAMKKTSKAKMVPVLAVAVSQSKEDLSDTVDDDRASSVASSDSGISSTAPSVPPPPPPPPPPAPQTPVQSDDKAHMFPASQHPPLTMTHSQPPPGIISLQDLKSVQLKKAENHTMKSALKPAHSIENLLDQKSHLIEELKMTRDIKGIRQMKEGRMQMEKEKEKAIRKELNKQFNVDTFVEKMPQVDGTGAPIPSWKRQMMAKKAAEKAKKEEEERRLREEEEKKRIAIPGWKRQLMQKKEPEPVPIIQERISNGKTEEVTKGNSDDAPAPQDDSENQVPQRHNPWQAQLRKTNSKLYENE